MADEIGIKETQELIVALGDLAAVVVPVVKAGGSGSEIAGKMAAALMANPGAIDSVKTAIAGISEVPSELKDLSLGEIMDLCEASVTTARKVVAAVGG